MRCAIQVVGYVAKPSVRQTFAPTRVIKTAFRTASRPLRTMTTQANRTLVDSGTCPYAQRAWIALVEKELPFTHKIVDLNDKPKDFVDLYATINPDPEARAKVPILIDADGTHVIESNVVAEYLDDRYPESGAKLMPADPAERAKVRLFMQLFGELISPGMFGMLRADSKAGVDESSSKLTRALEVLNKLLEVHGIEQQAEGGGCGSYLLGPRYSMAEVATTPFVRRAVVVLPQVRGYDVLDTCKTKGLARLERWIQASLQRPSATSTGPDDAGLVSSMQKFVVPLTD